MGTRQVAIIELTNLVEEEVEKEMASKDKGRKEKKKPKKPMKPKK